ncbi:MAG: hypothetical protein ACYCY2_08075 [Acidithiobacillus ferriphilus]
MLGGLRDVFSSWVGWLFTPVQSLRGSSPGRQTYGPGVSVPGYGSLFDASSSLGDHPAAIDESWSGPRDELPSIDDPVSADNPCSGLRDDVLPGDYVV